MSNLKLGSLFDGSGGFPLGGVLAGEYDVSHLVHKKILPIETIWWQKFCYE